MIIEAEQSQQQQNLQKRQYSRWFKAVIVILFIIGFVLYRVLFPAPNVSCIYDAYQVLTLPANRDLVIYPENGPSYEGKNDNPLSTAGKGFIGTGQVLVDLWIAIFGVIWIIKIKNLRGAGSFAIFFAIRAFIFLNVQKLPFPDNIVWRNPGFFSFTVPYDHTRDFFYSGHTGTLTVITLEMFTLQITILWLLGLFSCLFMMNMLIITQVHYVIDIIGGLVFAFWCYWFAIKILKYIDKLLSLPFFIVKWLYVNKCKGCCNQQEENKNPSSLEQNLTRQEQNKPPTETNLNKFPQQIQTKSLQIENRN